MFVVVIEVLLFVLPSVFTLIRNYLLSKIRNSVGEGGECGYVFCVSNVAAASEKHLRQRGESEQSRISAVPH